jgi:Ion channel
MDAAGSMRDMMRAAFHAYRRRRFAILFCVLLLTLETYAAVAALGLKWNPIEFLLAVSLVAAVGGAAHPRDRSLLAFGAAFVAIRTLEGVVGMGAGLSLSRTLLVIVGLMATVATVSHVMRPGAVDAERIFAALDTYLLAGVLFGVSYWMLEQALPGSFGVSRGGSLTQAKAIYFSFVTITTLGYGDVVPTGDAARGLAILEAVGGQMYLAVLVARLVSLYGRERG